MIRSRSGLGSVWPRAVATGILLSISCATPAEQAVPERRATIRELAALPTFRDVQFSPDSSRIAYASNDNEQGNWDIFTYSLSTRKIERLTFSAEAEVAPNWSPDGKRIAYLSDYGGDESHDIYLVPAGGGRSKRLVGGRSDERDIHWSPDSARIAFASDREPRPDGGKGYAIWWVAVDEGEPIRLTRADGDDLEPRWSPQGDQLAFTSTRNARPKESDIYVVSLDGEPARQLTNYEGGADAHPRWSADGKSILFDSDLNGFRNIGRIHLGDSEIDWFTSGDLDRESPAISPTGLVACTANDRGDFRIEFFRMGSRRSSPRPVSREDGVFRSPVWSADGKYLAFVYSGPVTPDEIWLWRERGSRTEKAIGAALDDESRGGMVSPVRVDYRVGLKTITAFLYGADPENPAPMRGGVVWLHDGPRGQWVNEWSPEVQTLVSAGYAVIAPNFRGSTGSGSDFEASNDRAWGDSELEDIVGAAQYLERLGIASKDKIAVGGAGYGGFLALLVARLEPTRWAAAVSISGWTDLERTYERARSTLRRQLQEEVGNPSDDADWYAYLSPVRGASSIACPVLLVSADRDVRVSAEDIEAMERALEKGGGGVQAFLYEYDGRGLRQRAHRVSSLREMRKFLRRHL